MVNKSVVLIGLSGSGKSTVVSPIARRLKLAHVDLDHVIESKVGQSASELISSKGEEQFRSVESEQLRLVLDEGPSVIATGGGVVLSQHNRDLLKENAFTVWLDAPIEVLLKRLESSHGRALLGSGDQMANNLRLQRRSRLKFYSLAADAILKLNETDSQENIAEEVVKLVESSGSQGSNSFNESVELANGREYPVVVAWNALDDLATKVPEHAKRAAIVTQAGIGLDVETGLDQKVFVVENGESAKRLEVIEQLCSGFAKWGLTRNDVVVAVGGGVVTDLAGFAAASYHRGTSVVHVPTSLLGQVDAAIGGKCGVNLAEGKNLVGAFWQPEAVICDVSTLQTLPSEEFLSGLGELAKYVFIQDTIKLDSILQPLASLPLVERVAASARIKAYVVAQDEREGGLRAILNYGHTLAHALETSGSYNIRHGEAVAVGLVYAAELALLLGRINQARVDEHRRVVESYALSTVLPDGADHDQLIELFARDKKATSGLVFVLDGPNGLEQVQVDDVNLLKKALNAVT